MADLSYTSDYVRDKMIAVKRLDPKAETPKQDVGSDAGYHITLIGREDNRAEDDVGCINTFNTGLIIQPPIGYRVEIVPNSSLHRFGYMMPGKMIIESTNTSELVIPLYKFSEGEDLELPIAAVQMVICKNDYVFLKTAKTQRVAHDNMLFMHPADENSMYQQNRGPMPAQRQTRRTNIMF